MEFVIGAMCFGAFLIGVYTSQWVKPLVEKGYRRAKKAVESRA